MRLWCFFIFLFPILSFSGQVEYSTLTCRSAPLVVVDAGHGGRDIGTKSRAPYCEEKRVALSTALLAKQYLEQLGYRVLLTRSSDAFIPLFRRVQKANLARCAIFVSIHYNSSPNHRAHGIEIYYCDQKKQKRRATASQKLAAAILQDLIKKTGARSRGVKKGNFYVIRETKMPAILVEGGFISNPQERKQLKAKNYQEKIARAVANGVDVYFKKSA